MVVQKKVDQLFLCYKLEKYIFNPCNVELVTGVVIIANISCEFKKITP